MRTLVLLQALVTGDVDQLAKRLDSQWQFDDDDSTSSTFSSGTYSLAASASAFPIPFGGVTAAAVVVIVADEEVQVQFDSNSAPLVPVRPHPAAPVGSALTSLIQQFDQPGLVLWTGKVTSIFLTNPSSSKAASVYVALVGEAA